MPEVSPVTENMQREPPRIGGAHRTIQQTKKTQAYREGQIEFY